MKRLRILTRRLGSALLATLILTIIMGIACASLISTAVARRNSTARLILYNSELQAAEAVLDSMVSQIYFAGLNRPPQVALSATGLSDFITNEFTDPALAGYNVGFAIETIVPNQTVLITEDLANDIGGTVATWEDYEITLAAYRIVAAAKATAASGLPGATIIDRPGVFVSKVVSFYQVPLLRYAIFYANNLELDAGQRIDIRGRVHTNQNYYLTTSSQAYYHDRITVAGNFYGGIYNPLDAGRRTWSGSQSIFINAMTNAAPGEFSTNLQQLYRPSEISINNGYLSSVNYNGQPGTPARWTTNTNWIDQANSIFRGNLRDRSLGAKTINIPLREDLRDTPEVMIDPPVLSGANADDQTLTSRKFAYTASVIIETGPNWPTSNDFVAYRMIPDETAPTGFRQSDPFSVTYRKSTDSPTATPRTFLSTQRIWNGREEKYVYLVDVDMTKLAEYLDPNSRNADTAGRPRFTLAKSSDQIPLWQEEAYDDGIIYVNPSQTAAQAKGLADTAAEATAARSSAAAVPGQAGVRIINGNNLAPVLQNSAINPTNGLTLATPAPLYTKGDINNPSSGSRIPLLLACDAVNILSNSFTDSTYQTYAWYNYAVGSRNGPKANAASLTTTNAVFITGNVPTMSNQYGGGAENFYRYIENWGSSRTHRFTGSMLNLFQSRIALGRWDKNPGTAASSGYYDAPRRDWSWDVNFSGGATPPGIPRSFEADVSSWRVVSKAYFEARGGSLPD